MDVSRTTRALSSAGVLAIASMVALGGLIALPRDVSANVVFQIATRLQRPAHPDDVLRTPSVTMSEGWGCAAFESESGRIHQCWTAGPRPHAFTAAGMKDTVAVSRDNWCAHDADSGTFQCWQRPRRGDTGPRELPAAWQGLNPHNGGPIDLYNRGDHVQDVLLGGTFACLRPVEAEGLFCLGDNRFGQLGSSGSRDRPSLSANAVFVGGLSREVKPALGTWHACAVAARDKIDGQTPVVCWGRGDHGQLGKAAPNKCDVGGKTVACARTPVRSLPVMDQMVVLGVGDLFSCVSSLRGTQCWGASRDGLFGVPGSCPESLRKAWPTPDGPVAAPHASCTVAPVTLPGATKFDATLEVSPREISYQGHVLNAVPAPPHLRLGRARVSPGSDASWCAPRSGGVVCWGEKYSPPGTPSRPVPIVFEPIPSLGDLAVLDGSPVLAARRKCQLQRPCPHPVQKLPACAEDNDQGRSVSEILGTTKSLGGPIVVRVRGALGVGSLEPTPESGIGGANVACDPADSCCERLEAAALVGGPEAAIMIQGLGCVGDESRACCNTPAYGQRVIATGTLVRAASNRTAVEWQLANASVCEVR